MHHAVRAELEQTYLRRAEAPTDGEAGAMSKTERRAAYDRRLRQTVSPGEIAERLAHDRIYAGLAEPRASGARWPMRTVQQ